MPSNSSFVAWNSSLTDKAPVRPPCARGHHFERAHSLGEFGAGLDQLRSAKGASALVSAADTGDTPALAAGRMGTSRMSPLLGFEVSNFYREATTIPVQTAIDPKGLLGAFGTRPDTRRMRKPAGTRSSMSSGG